MANILLKNIPIIRTAFVRPLLICALLVSVLFFFMCGKSAGFVTRLLLSWDVGVFIYLGLAVIMISRSSVDKIRLRAADLDEGKFTILGLSVFGAVASLAAIIHELVAAKVLSGHLQGDAIALAAGTVVLSWLFMQTMFALHYAHAFYSPSSENNSGGLEFPGKEMAPDYWDFVYFSFIIGTAAQTADINIISRSIRRVVTVQCVTVFFFNTTILALAINVGAGLV